MTYSDSFRHVTPDPTKYWQFDAVNSYVHTNVNLWNEENDFSFSVQVSGISSTPLCVIGTYSSSLAHGFAIYRTGFEVYFGGFVDGVSGWMGGSWGSTLSGSTWYEIGLTYTASTKTLRVYLDGALIGTKVLSDASDLGNTDYRRLIVGGRNSGVPYEVWAGAMRRLYVYTTVLTDGQMASLHDGEDVGSPVIEYDIQNINSSVLATNIGSGADGDFYNVTDGDFFLETDDEIPNPHPVPTLACKPTNPFVLDPYSTGIVLMTPVGRTGLYEVSGLTDGVIYEISVVEGDDPAATDPAVGFTSPPSSATDVVAAMNADATQTTARTAAITAATQSTTAATLASAIKASTDFIGTIKSLIRW